MQNLFIYHLFSFLIYFLFINNFRSFDPLQSCSENNLLQQRNYDTHFEIDQTDIETQLPQSFPEIVTITEINDNTNSTIEIRLERIENEMVRHTVLLNEILRRMDANNYGSQRLESVDNTFEEDNQFPLATIGDISEFEMKLNDKDFYQKMVTFLTQKIFLF